MEARTAFAWILVGVLTVLSGLVVEPFLDYVLAAMLLAFVLSPVQRRLEPAVGAKPSALALVVVTVALVVGPVGLLLRAAVAEVEQVPASVSEIPGFEPVQRLLETNFGVQVAPQVDRLVRELSSIVAARGSGLASAGLHVFLGVLLLLFLLYYLLADGSDLLRWAKGVTPLPKSVQDQLYEEAEDATWAVLKGHVFVAVAQGLVSGVGLFVAGVPDSAFWTVVMMFLATVPIVGVSPVMGGAAVWLLVEGRLVAAVLLVVYGMSAVAVTDDYLRALVVDHESSLHSGVVLLGVFGAAYFLGAIGLFVGPILLAVSKATVEVFVGYYDLSTY